MGNIILEWMFFFTVLAYPIDMSNGCVEEEKSALLLLQSSFFPPYQQQQQHHHLSLWGINHPSDCCSWKGIECNQTTRRVISIDMFNLFVSQETLLNKYLNASLFLPFQHLTHLSLSHGDLLGFIDSNQGLAKLHQLTRLELLDLSFNRFNSTLLSSIGESLSSLKILRLRGNSMDSVNDLKGLCNLKQLQVLDLWNNHFAGELPQCLSNLTSLQVLDLSDNHFTGDISFSPLKSLVSITELRLTYNSFIIPSSLSPFFNLSRLKFLYADHNQLIYNHQIPEFNSPSFQLLTLYLSAPEGCSGSHLPGFLHYQRDLQALHITNVHIQDDGFPTWLLDNNTNLRELNLVNDSLSGSIQFNPHWNLTQLDISDNNFAGQIPLNISSSLPSLSSLVMSSNAFNGTIPDFVGSQLLDLDLSNNRLSGTLPQTLAKGCPSLRTLALSGNRLEGRILEFGLKRLMTLRLDGNQFVGEIPVGLSTSIELNFLDVSSNELSGTIPLWLSKMSSLDVLDLSSNNFNGELPRGFPSPSMTQVYLSKNRLVGRLQINDSVDIAYQLLILDISHNNLTGPIPRQIDKMSRLRYILIHDNNFQGQIPPGMCKLEHLRLIDFSNNLLSGPILPCIKTRAHWTRQEGDDEIGFLDAATPAIEPMEITTKAFPYSYQGRNLLLMSGINLANNNFNGEIPEEFGNLTTIKLLNLSCNDLTGSIPSTFSSLKQMESLDLSYNNLTGSIPPTLVDLNSLAVFSVAYNNLSGKTPERIAQFATFSENCYDGNPLLCGWPLSTKCTQSEMMTQSPALLQNEEDHSDWIDMEVFTASFTVSFGMVLAAIAAVLYINENWRRVWFYYVEMVMTVCYYFIVDHLPVPPKYRVLDSSSGASW
ncbi:Receptor-like protein 56 [Linum perenne]